MTDDKKTDIMKFDPPAPLRSPRMIRVLASLDRPVEIVRNAILDDMSDEARNRRVQAVFEEAALFIAQAKDPMKLLQCTQESTIETLATHAHSGLSLARSFDEAYLIPYKNVMTWMSSYKGLVKLVVNTGLVTSVRTHIVYEGDEFEPRLGTDGTILHIPQGLHAGDMSKVVATYALFRMRTGEMVPELIWRDELEKIRKTSKASNSPAYEQWGTQMWRKAPVRRGTNYLAKSHGDAGRRLANIVMYENEKYGLIERGQQVAQEHSKQLEAAVTESLTEPAEEPASDQQPEGNENGLPGAPPCMSCGEPLDHTSSDPLCTACRNLEPQHELFDTDEQE